MSILGTHDTAAEAAGFVRSMKSTLTAIQVAMSFDEGYAKYAAVTALSAMLHTSGPIKFHFQVSGLSKSSYDLVSSIVAKFGSECAFIEMDDAQFSDLEFGDLAHLSSATYYRLALPDLIEEDRCIYLDCDVIVTCDLAQLFAEDLDGAAVGGCRDKYSLESSPMTEVLNDRMYLNTGVLLMDFNILRSINFRFAAMEDYARHVRRIRFADQCLINKTLDGRKIVLPGRWNVQAHDYPAWSLKEVMEPLDRTAIFHGSGPSKPWMTWSDPWLHALWKSYARLLDRPISSMTIEPRETNELLLKANMHESAGEWRQAAEEKGRLITLLDDHLKQIAP